MAKGSLMILSGNGQQISQRLQQTFGFTEWTIVPIDEKQITNPIQLIRLLRREKVQVLAFGCKDLTLQRFQFWLSAFLCVCGAPNGLIMDEAGATKKVDVVRFVFADVPRFCLELIMSMCVIARAWVYLALSHPSSNDK